MSDFNDFLMGGGGPPVFKFATIGDSVRGKIVAAEVNQQTDLDQKPKFFESGQPMMQVVVTLQTDLRDPEIDEDDGRRRLFVKFKLRDAVREAVTKAGEKEMKIGGTLAVQHHADEPPSRVGHSPTKLYRAKYEAPSITVDDFDTTPAAPAPAQAPVAQPAPQAQRPVPADF